MDIGAQSKLLIFQIKSLIKIIRDRIPDVDLPLTDDELSHMNADDLRQVKMILHEIVYSPPPRT